MRYSVVSGPRIGSVPAVILLAIIDSLEERHRRRYDALYRDCKKVAGRIPKGMFNQALVYLVRDGAIKIERSVVRQTARWNRSEIVSIAKESREIGRRPRGRTPRKAVRKKSSYPSRKKSAYPTGKRFDFGGLDDFAPEPPQQPPSRKVRTYRDNPKERFGVQIFWATDRERDSDGVYLNSGQHGKFERGRALVSFPENHEMGKIEEPHKWKIVQTLSPRGFCEIESAQRLPPSKFYDDISRELREHADSIFVFVHGYNASFEQALKRTAQLALDTNFQGTAVAFSWPSRAHYSCYEADRDRIPMASQRLSEFLTEIREQHKTATIHVVAHSMGAEISARALNSLPAFDASEIVLQAPDISTIDYSGLMDALNARSRRITVYTNEEDRALKLSAKGRKGLTAVVIERVGQSVLNAVHRFVDAIDATKYGKDGWWSHGYAFKKELVIDLRQTLDNAPQVRAQLEQVNDGGVGYYRFR